MSFYVVKDSELADPSWLAWEDTDNAVLYAFVPNLGAFVRHDTLRNDFYWDMEMEYRPADVDEAARIVEAGAVGRLDARTYQKGVLDRLSKIQDRKAPTELLVGSRLRPATISARRAAIARAKRVSQAAPGQWVTWKKYSPEHKQRAYVAANNLRNGKIKALADVPIEVKLAEDEQGSVLVLVTRRNAAGPVAAAVARVSSR